VGQRTKRTSRTKAAPCAATKFGTVVVYRNKTSYSSAVYLYVNIMLCQHFTTDFRYLTKPDTRNFDSTTQWNQTGQFSPVLNDELTRVGYYRVPSSRCHVPMCVYCIVRTQLSEDAMTCLCEMRLTSQTAQKLHSEFHCPEDRHNAESCHRCSGSSQRTARYNACRYTRRCSQDVRTAPAAVSEPPLPF